jgi:7-keto-8-aminopelargonate synthetase-like enzyme
MIGTLNQIIEDGLQRKLVHNFTSSGHQIPNSSVVIDDHEMINFGSCSYLGLERHPKLQHAVVDAVTKYGTQFSSSRTYLSHGLYQELERLLSQMFDRPVIATASTTLGHLATIPVVVGKDDAIILDLQVHSSIQMTVQQLKAKQVTVKLIKHNCMDSLEASIKQLYNKHDKIWYFADGVYSMYGDYAPFSALDTLLSKYKKFYAYIDDAHGMGWTGSYGSGVAWNKIKHKEKMILAVSLNKSFAAAGGCFVFPNKVIEKSVRNCGATYIFSGPIQPPMLGAAVASAKLHLSDEIKKIQEQLLDLIHYTNSKLDSLNLPQYQKTASPLFFIPVGLPKICCDIILKMKEKGFFLNTASFPAVPMRKSGLRFMINTLLYKQQIDAMLTTLCGVYSEVINDHGISSKSISKTFRIPDFKLHKNNPKNHAVSNEQLYSQCFRSIRDLDQQQWNTQFSDNGMLDYANIEMIEAVFTNTNNLENNWEFYYLIIKDAAEKIVLKTLITVALTKDDMFHPAYVSEKIEEQRTKNDPYYLSSKTVLTGTLITKGNHVYIAYEHPLWRNAVTLLTQQLNTILEEHNAAKIMIRDFFSNQHPALEDEMLEKGFTKFQLPSTMVIHELNWNTVDEYLSSLSQKYRYNVKKEILHYQHHFITDYSPIRSTKSIKEAYQLYEQVYERSSELNVFKLPLAYFENMCCSSAYDIIRLYLTKPTSENNDSSSKVLVGVMFSHVSKMGYNALLVGLNYQYVYEYNCYKQLLFQTLVRAKELQSKHLDLAFTAVLEKKKIGARPHDVFAYVQVEEHLKERMLTFI